MTDSTCRSRGSATRRRCAWVVAALMITNLRLAGIAVGEPLSPDARIKYEAIIRSIGEAQRREDEAAVLKHADEAKAVLGPLAGEPEEQEEYRQTTPEVKLPTPQEAVKAFEPYRSYILRNKWWRIGDDPTKAERPLRDVASVVSGCVDAREAGCQNGDELLALAADAAEYLLWTQEQAERGLFPFPARRGGPSRPFRAAEGMLRKAERAGRLEDVVHQGWIVDDLGDGGLQFDNGVCGTAILRLYQATKDPKYLQSVKRAAEWAMQRPVVPNWNYNGFSVYLLAETAKETGDKRFLDAALKKARLGIYPGQLTDGPHQGRWFDGHNARLPYHYILVRTLVSLASALEESSAEQRQALDALRLALQARNKDFIAKGIGNTDLALEALLLLEQNFPDSTRSVGEAGQKEAVDAIEAYCVAKMRDKQPALMPAAWGLYLNSLKGRGAPQK
jgi:hypothetical protein